MWAPERITPWFYLPSYSLLPVEVQKAYNQLYALAVNEIFSLFEMNFLLKILVKLQSTAALDAFPVLKEGLVYFCAEEEKHSEMFWRLGEAARPQYYPGREFYFVKKASVFGRLALEIITTRPQDLLVWVWVAIFFEERTLMYSKEYIKGASSLDSQFVQAHRLHMLEELRHVRMDHFLIDVFYKHQSPLKKKLAGLMMKRVVRDFASPRRMSYVLAKELAQQFPECQKTFKRLLQELPALGHNKDFHGILFSKDATDRTRELMGQHREFDGLWDFME